jgi:hypothetical protein
MELGMQTKHFRCRGINVDCAKPKEKSLGNIDYDAAKVREITKTVLITLGLISTLCAAMLSDAESIGKFELFIGILLGVALLLGGAYLHKVEPLLRRLVKLLMHWIKRVMYCVSAVKEHAITGVRTKRTEVYETEPMDVIASASSSRSAKKELIRPVRIKISCDNTMNADTCQVAS